MWHFYRYNEATPHVRRTINPRHAATGDHAFDTIVVRLVSGLEHVRRSDRLQIHPSTVTPGA